MDAWSHDSSWRRYYSHFSSETHLIDVLMMLNKLKVTDWGFFIHKPAHHLREEKKSFFLWLIMKKRYSVHLLYCCSCVFLQSEKWISSIFNPRSLIHLWGLIYIFFSRLAWFESLGPLVEFEVVSEKPGRYGTIRYDDIQYWYCEKPHWSTTFWPTEALIVSINSLLNLFF